MYIGRPASLVEGAVHGLRADDLRRRGHQRGQTGGQTHRRNQFHGTRQNLLGLESLELGHHVRIHAARNLGLLHQLVGSGESEVGLDLAAEVDRSGLVVALRGLDGLVEQGLDLGGELVRKRIEGLRLGPVPNTDWFSSCESHARNFATAFHVDAQLLAEAMDQLDVHAPVPPAKYQQLVSTTSTPATMAESTDARP